MTIKLILLQFDDHVTDKRRPIDPELPFEFCYDLRSCVRSCHMLLLI